MKHWKETGEILVRVLPGVTVTARSPALQAPHVTDVTNEQGEYRLAP